MRSWVIPYFPYYKVYNSGKTQSDDPTTCLVHFIMNVVYSLQSEFKNGVWVGFGSLVPPE